ncbi:ATP-dependent DNA helicase PIF6-like [Aphis craccivora]|uniref:ATP-dependent DNA helicase PIF6-like n=1 Tax=Aphis craccivora TaxID=307492 RepID=A0A6G0YDF1_APHCR|nr:ATP-dependent DNA helicase PIF6-like [Aphis craccivora]
MNINNGQGQTLDVAGIDFIVQFFSHRKLYIYLYRVKSKSNMYIFAPNTEEVELLESQFLVN